MPDLNENPPTATLPPLFRDQRKVDTDHLRLLAIFHFIIAGLALCGIGFLFLHSVMMHTFFSNPTMWEKQHVPPPPQGFLGVFIVFYCIFGGLLVIGALANLLSGLWIRARRNRTFSLIVAAINCLQVPFGTVLGVFTLIVLLRDSVRQLYEVHS